MTKKIKKAVMPNLFRHLHRLITMQEEGILKQVQDDFIFVQDDFIKRHIQKTKSESEKSA